MSLGILNSRNCKKLGNKFIVLRLLRFTLHRKLLKFFEMNLSYLLIHLQLLEEIIFKNTCVLNFCLASY